MSIKVDEDLELLRMLKEINPAYTLTGTIKKTLQTAIEKERTKSQAQSRSNRQEVLTREVVK